MSSPRFFAKSAKTASASGERQMLLLGKVGDTARSSQQSPCKTPLESTLMKSKLR